jgi:hypothetical protein
MEERHSDTSLSTGGLGKTIVHQYYAQPILANPDLLSESGSDAKFCNGLSARQVSLELDNRPA